LALFIALTKGKLVEKVHGRPRVMSQLLRFLPIFYQRIARQADAFIEVDALLHPVLMPHLPAPVGLRGEGRGARGGKISDGAVDRLDRFIRLDEKLQLHLFELARAKGEIARVDLVAERFANLTNAERQLLP